MGAVAFSGGGGAVRCPRSFHAAGRVRKPRSAPKSAETCAEIWSPWVLAVVGVRGLGFAKTVRDLIEAEREREKSRASGAIKSVACDTNPRCLFRPFTQHVRANQREEGRIRLPHLVVSTR